MSYLHRTRLRTISKRYRIMNRTTIIGYVLAAVFAAGFVYQTMQVNKLKNMLTVEVKALQEKVQGIGEKPAAPAVNNFMDTTIPQKEEAEEPAASMSAEAEFKLDGRTVETKELPESNLAGVVVIGISVDQEGKVVKATVGATSTIKDEAVLEAAKEAALKTRFNATDDGAAKTVGNITYRFTQN